MLRATVPAVEIRVAAGEGYASASEGLPRAKSIYTLSFRKVSGARHSSFPDAIWH